MRNWNQKGTLSEGKTEDDTAVSDMTHELK